MNPFKALALAIMTHVTEFRARMNRNMVNMPPLEQIEAGEVAKNLIRQALWAKEDADRLAEAHELTEAKLNSMFEEASKEIAEQAMTAALASGEIIKKEDHVNLIAQAKTDAKTEAQTEFASEQKRIALIAERRTKVAEKVGEIAAAAATDEQLAADTWESVVATVEARVARLAEIKITAEAKPHAFKSLATIPLTDEGAKEFDLRLPVYAELAAAAPTPNPAPPKTPAAPAVITGNGDTPEKKKHLI
jgi:hypothetical protein